MAKIFINVWPENCRVKVSEFTKEYVDFLLEFTQVKTSPSFDPNDVVDLMLLDQADRLQMLMRLHRIESKMGLLFNPQRNYFGWTLVIENDDACSFINPLVSKFFCWDRIESQNILKFDELTA